jgi:hypothetical protein
VQSFTVAWGTRTLRVTHMGFDSAALAFLRDRGAESIEHPGGTLGAHLRRVRQRLATLGAVPYLQLAGLTHAAYGTDGFDRALLPWTDRDALRAVVGDRAEELVYLYGACDRGQSWAALASTRAVHDRFTGQRRPLDAGRVVPFVDLTIVNELDVMEQNPAMLDRHGDYFRDLFASWAPVTSPSVADDARQVLSRKTL